MSEVLMQDLLEPKVLMSYLYMYALSDPNLQNKCMLNFIIFLEFSLHNL